MNSSSPPTNHHPQGESLAALRDQLKLLVPQKSDEEVIEAIEQEYRAAPSDPARNVVDAVLQRLKG